MLLRAQIGYGESQRLESPISLKEQQVVSAENSSELFVWTLSHSIVPFANVKPRFFNKEELLSFILKGSNDFLPSLNFKSISEEISNLAHEKMVREWSEWVRVHQGSRHFDEGRLDNMLMWILYRFILNRDGNQCVLCSKCQELTIHHIVRKQRNNVLRIPPFGRSVPTNLVTLCRTCHSKFEPYISSFNH